jgi:cytochrome c oxidase assembly factor CtaG
MRWWCSAKGNGWQWEYQPYLGAWVVAIALGLGMWRSGAFAPEIPRRRKQAAALGILTMLVATEWPLAALGAGYLVTAQMIRQVLIVLIAVPFLLYGAPPSFGQFLTATPTRRKVLRIVSSPGLALLGATTLLVVVNIPPVVDNLVVSQWGSFLTDVLWVIAGFLMWIPVAPPVGITPRVKGVPGGMYLFLVSIAPLPIAFFMTWSELPIFSVFELAPRVFQTFDARTDQEVAAAVFQVVGGMVIWVQIAFRFISEATEGEKRFRGTLVPDPTKPVPSTLVNGPDLNGPDRSEGERS